MCYAIPYYMKKPKYLDILFREERELLEQYRPDTDLDALKETLKQGKVEDRVSFIINLAFFRSSLKKAAA